jgi:hypothetical protein
MLLQINKLTKKVHSYNVCSHTSFLGHSYNVCSHTSLLGHSYNVCSHTSFLELRYNVCSHTSLLVTLVKNCVLQKHCRIFRLYLKCHIFKVHLIINILFNEVSFKYKVIYLCWYRIIISIKILKRKLIFYTLICYAIENFIFIVFYHCLFLFHGNEITVNIRTYFFCTLFFFFFCYSSFSLI